MRADKFNAHPTGLSPPSSVRQRQPDDRSGSLCFAYLYSALYTHFVMRRHREASLDAYTCGPIVPGLDAFGKHTVMGG